MRRIPDNNLSYPVSVQLANGAQGTGFYVNARDALFFVTARHVLFHPGGTALISDRATLTAYNRVLPGDPAIILELDLSALAAARMLLPHPSQDVAVIRIAQLISTGTPTMSLVFTAGITERNPTKASLVGIDSVNAAKRFDAVLEANEVIVFGYPTSLGVSSQPQLDLSKPLLRRGMVAAKNVLNRTIVLDCPIYPGNSGGPVLEIEYEGPTVYFRAIGVVVEFVPAAERWVNRPYGYENINISNSGYSIAVPFDAVDEVVAILAP